MRNRLLAMFAALLLAPALAAAPLRLVVIIGLDQFPESYLNRFRPHLGKGGFALLRERGAEFVAATYEHACTSTGPGHAVIATGSYGRVNGIALNTWFDAATDRDVYCVGDSTVRLLGAQGSGRSPRNLIGATIGDELRIATGFRSKVVSISHKDRSAILLGGKLADAAYWFHDGGFVSSSYYLDRLPDWVNAFNASDAVTSFFGSVWDRALPPAAYAGMDEDDAAYEGEWTGLGRTFPRRVTGRDTARITPSYYDAFLASPFSVDVLFAFARSAIEAEALGADEIPDILCVDVSTTDRCGHAFGPHSHEMLDLVVRLDRSLEGFLDYLEARCGLENILIVLTADHGVTPIPEYLRKHVPHADAGRHPVGAFERFCERSLAAVFGPPAEGRRWIRRIFDGAVYLDAVSLRERRVDRSAAAAVLADSLSRVPDMALAVAADDLARRHTGSPLEERFRRSHHAIRGGDVLFAFRPYHTLSDGTAGADHGSPYEDDAHVPLIMMGPGLVPGVYAGEASPADIAPTLSAILEVEFPPAREGRVLMEALQLPARTRPSPPRKNSP